MADILIKNMEMPKSCGECKLAVNAYGSLTEGKCAVLGYGVTYLRERHDACPLVEVPPHGDLIAKGNVLFNLQVEALIIDPKDKDFEGIKKGLLIARKIIIKAPVILEASK